MKKSIAMLLAASLAPCAALAAQVGEAANQGEDPRRTYSTNGWEQIWADDFDGESPFSYLENWYHQVGFLRNNEPQYYTSNRVENCTQKDGILTITARREKWPNPRYDGGASGDWRSASEFARYTSADIVSRRSFLYGRIEFRAQLPCDWGAWPALWFVGDCSRWPEDDPERFTWPASGELDLVEIWGSRSNRVVSTIHTASRGPEPGETYVARNFHKQTRCGVYEATAPETKPCNGFHTYTLDWYEDRLFFFYDGWLYGEADISMFDWPDGRNPFRKPFYAIMNLALGGWNNPVVDEDTVDEKTGAVIPAIQLPMEMKIDWMRYYRRAAQTGATQLGNAAREAGEASCAGELLANGSFEAGGDGVAAGWRLPAHWRVEDGAGMNGTRGIAFENLDDAGYYKFPLAPIPFEEGMRYEYSAWTRTEGLENGKANICVEWMDADGKWMAGSYQVGPGGTSDWTQMKGVTPPMPPTAKSARVAFYVSRGGLGKAWFDDVSVRPVRRPFFGGMFSSAYRNLAADDKVVFRAAAKLSEHPGATVRFFYTAWDGAMRNVAPTGTAPDAAVLEIDVTSLAMGTHRVRCEIVAADGKFLGGGSIDFTRAAELPARRTWIDGKRRTIVDGKPFFPLGMYTDSVGADRFRNFLSGPFNCVMPYKEPSLGELDFCHSNGIEVLYPLNSVWAWHKHRPKGVDTDEVAQAYVERVVDERKNHPAILAWYCNDEIPQEHFPQLIDRQRLLERIDSGHPTWTVLYQYGDIRDYYPTFDVVGADPYPIPASPIGNVAVWTRTANDEVMGLKPLWMVPQAFAWEDFGSKGRRFPTREELLNMTWQCVANGANGIVYFTYRTLYKDGKFLEDRWADICAAAESVKLHTPIILSDEDPPLVSGATDELSVRAWRYQGSVYLAVVNNTRNPVTGTIDIDEDIGPVETIQGSQGCSRKNSRAIHVSLDGLGVAFLRAPLAE